MAPERETIYSGPSPEPPPERIPEPDAVDVEEVERDLAGFVLRVFAWIGGALFISALFASYSDRWNQGLFFQAANEVLFPLIGGLFVLAFLISRNVGDMPASVATATLVAYAAVQGTLFGLAYRSIYGTSLAPVYVAVALVFCVTCVYGRFSGGDLTSRKSLLIGVGLAPVIAAGARIALDLTLLSVCAACVCSWLMLALAGYHRDFLRDLPATFEQDDHWQKAAAVGALQIYIDLAIILVIVVQMRWLRQFFSEEKFSSSKKLQP